MIYPFARPLFDLCAPIVWHGQRSKRAVALTFDDCYSYDLLISMEGILDANSSAKVTFFPTGIALRNTSSKDPHLWKRFLDKGHEIGYHGYNHEMPSNLDYWQSTADFGKWKETLHSVLGHPANVKFARPPYGDISSNFLRICCENSLIIVMWSANWSIAHRTGYREVDLVQGGDIVIFHIRYQDIVNFETILPMLRDKGLAVVSLSELLLAQDNIPEKSEYQISDSEIEPEAKRFPNRSTKICIK